MAVKGQAKKARQRQSKAATDKTAVDALNRLKEADALLKAGDADGALAVGTALSEAFPDFPLVYNLLARIHGKRGDSAAVMACFEKVAALDPQDPVALERLAEAQLKARLWDKARETIGALLALEPRDRSLIALRRPLTIVERDNDDPFLSITLEPETLWEIGRQLLARPLELLGLPTVRKRLGRQRRLAMMATRGMTLLEETNNIIHNAVVHNVDKIEIASDDGARPNLLIHPLTAIDYVNVNAARMKVLTIGPRSETEIFCLMAAGFQLDNIEAVDLISFSPLIKSGDMHALPFADESFDIVIAGWVMAYSKNNPQAAAEILRVAKPNAYIAVGCAYTPRRRGQRAEDHVGKNIVGTRFSDVADILQHFTPHIKHVYFSGEVERDRRIGSAAVTTVFQVKADY